MKFILKDEWVLTKMTLHKNIERYFLSAILQISTKTLYSPQSGLRQVHPVGHRSQSLVLIRRENTADNKMALHIVTIKIKRDK